MESVIADLTELQQKATNTDLIRMYQYWQSKRGATRPFPSRRDIDPLEFTFALNKVSLIDVMANPRRFFFAWSRPRLPSGSVTK